MLIGGSCGGRYSRPITGITCYENRILQNNEHKYFWQDSKYCIDNNIYLIVNIDTYLTGSRWRPTNPQLRQFVLETKTKLKSLGANKANCRFTYDNETDEYTSFDDYMNGVRVIHDALSGQFDLGAGNFRTPRKDWYEALAKLSYQKYYEVFDFHMQDGLDSTKDIDSYTAYIKALKYAHKLRLAVTEGNNFWNVSTSNGHNLLKYQIEKADEIGCEQFCFVYANWTSNSEEDHQGMSYCVNDRWVTDYWNNMINLIISKKPITPELDDMKLSVLKLGSTGNQVLWVQEILELEYGYENEGGFDGKYGSKTFNQISAYQKDNGLTVDGIVGKFTMADLVNKSSDVKKWMNKLEIYMAYE